MTGLIYHSPPRLLSVRYPDKDPRLIDCLRYQQALRRQKRPIDMAELRRVMGPSFPRFGRIAEPTSDPGVAPPRWPMFGVAAHGLAANVNDACLVCDLDQDLDHAFGRLQARVVGHQNLSSVLHLGEDAESAAVDTPSPTTRSLERHMAEIQRMNAIIDNLGLTLREPSAFGVWPVHRAYVPARSAILLRLDDDGRLRRAEPWQAYAWTVLDRARSAVARLDGAREDSPGRARAEGDARRWAPLAEAAVRALELDRSAKRREVERAIKDLGFPLARPAEKGLRRLFVEGRDALRRAFFDQPLKRVARQEPAQFDHQPLESQDKGGVVRPAGVVDRQGHQDLSVGLHLGDDAESAAVETPSPTTRAGGEA